MPLFHLRANATNPDRGPTEVDFFVVAISETEAGARAHDAFRENDWAFGEYVVLPHEVNKHLLAGALAQAADIALRDGESFYVQDAA
jgi:hypothetical protein